MKRNQLTFIFKTLQVKSVTILNFGVTKSK
jgi:hypothetical protein